MLTQNALRTPLILFFIFYFARTEKLQIIMINRALFCLTESTYPGFYFPQLLSPVVCLKAFSLLI